LASGILCPPVQYYTSKSFNLLFSHLKSLSLQSGLVSD
jgi:hypothetical protein